MTDTLKVVPVAEVDTRARPAPPLGPQPHNQKIDPVVVDIETRPTPVLGPGPPNQKIDTEAPTVSKAQPTRVVVPPPHNAHVNTLHPSSNYIPPPKKKIIKPFSCGKNKFKSCICWTISLIFLLLVIVGSTVGILYLIFRPKIPKYSVDSLRISELRLNFDLSLYAKFDVKIIATNPNKKIGIFYRKGSRLSVWYSNMMLCQGSLPIFYQGHQNTTKLDVGLTGQNQYGSTLMAALQQQQQTGRIPLDLKVDVPVSIKLGKLKLRKIRILGTCLLTVDSLSANSFITIKASTCKFRVKL